MISIIQKGSFSKVIAYFKKLKQGISDSTFKKYGEKGIAALTVATPKDTGLTSKSWSYQIEKTKTSVTLSFYNANIQNGVPIAIIIQYGHSTGNGYWVEGVDYINPALRPVFNGLAEELWEEVKEV
ncbi:MAG: HK97 gp10 family phage protein [Clostridia bacterium]|nr:HK97 gp10 family phage protein [Clostridia bacterium]